MCWGLTQTQADAQLPVYVYDDGGSAFARLQKEIMETWSFTPLSIIIDTETSKSLYTCYQTFRDPEFRIGDNTPRPHVKPFAIPPSQAKI